MANRNAKLIERVLKDFSLGIGSGGGAQVVTELPEVGEPHTVYELHEQVKPSYNWVARVTDEMANIEPSYNVLIFDTFEQMTNIIEHNNIWGYSLYYHAYLRNEDKLYNVRLDPRGGDIRYAEYNKISNYIFEVNFDRYIYVLKSYEGYDEATDKGYGTLYDDTKVELGNFDNINHNAFILHQAIFDCMNRFTNFASIIPSVTQLPTAQEAVANYLDDLISTGGSIFVEIDGVVKGSLPDSEDYYFDTGLENFYTNDENSVVYTGPLEWKDISSTVYTEIPYNDINELKSWVFKPDQGGEKISYWIYTKDEWVNMDEMKPKIPIIYFSWYDGESFNGLDADSITLQVNNEKVELIEVDNGIDDCRKQFIGYIDQSSEYLVNFEKDESLWGSLYYCSNFSRTNADQVIFDEMGITAEFTTNSEPIVIIFESRPQM